MRFISPGDLSEAAISSFRVCLSSLSFPSPCLWINVGVQVYGAAPGLLDDVGQFMKEQFSPGPRLRRILSRTENDMVSGGICARRDSPCRLVGSTIGMHPDMPKIKPEPRLQIGPGLLIERLTRRA